MLVSLKPLLKAALEQKTALAAFNIFSYGWARVLIEAAEEENQALILQVNPAMVSYLRPAFLAPMLCDLAQHATIDVCIQLDHGKDEKTIKEALDAGFSSIMFDGSALSLSDNIAKTQQIVKLASVYEASVEGEVGQIRYTDLPQSRSCASDPQEVAVFSQESGVHALAVSVGNIHRSTLKDAAIDYELVAELQEKSHSLALVIHGGSSLQDSDLLQLRSYGVAKYNISTVLRMAYAEQLRKILQEDGELFDTLEIGEKALVALKPLAKRYMSLLAQPVFSKSLGGENWYG